MLFLEYFEGKKQGKGPSMLGSRPLDLDCIAKVSDR